MRAPPVELPSGVAILVEYYNIVEMFGYLEEKVC